MIPIGYQGYKDREVDSIKRKTRNKESMMLAIRSHELLYELGWTVVS
jgi:hypothetical protein